MKLILIKAVLATYLGAVSASLLAEGPAANNTDIAFADNSSVYPVSFFSQYTPQNAMQMVNRLPGFSFDGGSDGRGFGGNAGNVLIDGVRPTSKAGGLKGALQRIPASQVLHIEILRGGVGAGEAAGQSIVANVIKKDIDTSGTWSVDFERSSNGVVKPDIEASFTIKFGEWDMLFDAEISGEPIYRVALIEYFDANDALTSSSDEVKDTLEEDVAVGGEASRELAGGTLTINAALSDENRQDDTARDIYVGSLPTNSAPDELSLLNEQRKTVEAELGVDWVITVDGWRWRMIGLASSHDSLYENSYHFEQQNSDNTDDSQYEKDTLKTEYIARTTYGKVGAAQFKPEFGVEIANNQLDTDIDLIENNVQQVLEGADTVKELRAEVFANFVYTAGQNLILEGGLTAEISEIEVTGESSQSQRFNFLKPRLSANYTIDDSSTFTLVAERTVEQLDFNDFAASSNTSDSRTTSGNSNLKPESTAVLSAIYDWRFSERGSLKVEAKYERRKDIHEKIFLPSGNQGLGNAGDANYWRVKTSVNLPVDAILDNGLLELSYSYRGSEFDDPIINNTRTISGYSPRWLRMEFRQDVSQYGFSWGVVYWGDFKSKNFYVDEIKTVEGNKRLGRIYIETTRFFNIKSRLEIKHANVSRYTRSRYFYQDDRSGEFEGSQVAHREREPDIKLSFSSVF